MPLMARATYAGAQRCDTVSVTGWLSPANNPAASRPRTTEYRLVGVTGDTVRSVPAGKHPDQLGCLAGPKLRRRL